MPYEFVKDGKKWDLVDSHTGLVVAELRPYEWGRGFHFRVPGEPWVKDKGSFIQAPRVAYPGLVRSKKHAVEVVQILRGEIQPPERWHRQYVLPRPK